jgi:iron(III) transport system substrate-binding protein
MSDRTPNNVSPMARRSGRRPFVAGLAGTALVPILAACGGAAPSSSGSLVAGSELEKELVVYSARKEELFEPTVKLFQQKTGVKVTVKSGATGELAQLIEQERTSPRGDIFFTTDAGDAETLRQKQVLEAYRSPGAEKIPAEFRAPDGTWTGVVGRSRNFIINTNLVKPGEAPQSVLELTTAKWKNKIAVASIREGGVRLWLAGMLLTKGQDFTTKYVNDLKANGLGVLTNHTEVVNAVVRGEFPVGLINHYYYVRKRKENVTNIDLVYPDQGANDMGTVITPITVGVIKGARNGKAARAFVDFILTSEGQVPMTTQGQEFPLTAGVPLGDAGVPSVRPIDKIKRPSVEFIKIAQEQQRAVDLFTPLLTS